MELLHLDSRIRVVVDFYTSKEVSTKSRVRQGCLLAPLLFALGMELLVRKLDGEETLGGMGTEEVVVKTALYANNTAIYLNEEEDFHVSIKVVGDFELASDMKVNWGKSLCIMGENNFDCSPLEKREEDWLLGCPVGMNINWTESWFKVLKDLDLVVELWKSSNCGIFGRVAGIKAFSISKIPYLASCGAPLNELTQKIKEKLWSVVNKGSFRSRIGYTKAYQEKECGGLGILDLQTKIESILVSW